MVKIILGVIVGFIVWSILWVGSSSVMAQVIPDYAESFRKMEFSTFWLVVAIIRSVIFSVISGFIAVLISKEISKTTMGLGVLLVAFGLFVQIANWTTFPIWYHLIFLALLIPMTMVGGKLRKE